jgi:hypothetical protein
MTFGTALSYMSIAADTYRMGRRGQRMNALVL